ncbi:hypothetical protein ACP4OV_024222 [Aristida adscensionis]
MQGAAAARVRYVPLGERRHGGGGGREYAARRAVFLRTYRLPAVDDGAAAAAEEGLRGRVARRLREAVARARGAAARWSAGRAWRRGWRARAADPLLGCFGAGAGAAHHKYYLHEHCYV